MGINCPDIKNVIHCGAPFTTEQYIQETGQAGRNGVLTVTLLYGKPRKPWGWSNGKVLPKYIVRNVDIKLHLILLSYKDDISMLETWKCCDICALKCHCNE